MARLVKIVTVAAGLALALVGCSSTTPPGADNSLGTITAGSLTMCADSPFPPFEYEDSSTATGYTGFDVDIMGAIADQLGLKLVFMDQDFDTIQSGAVLEAGTCDVGASAITITEDRKANLDFTAPYYDSIQSLLVPVSSGVSSLDGLAGKNIGVQTGTTGEMYANDHKPEGANTVSFSSDGEEWLALQAGQVDALLQDYPVNARHAKDDSAYAVVAQYPTDEHYGFAMAKGKNPTLLQKIDDALATIRSNGTYDEIYTRYFGVAPAAAASAAAN